MLAKGDREGAAGHGVGRTACVTSSGQTVWIKSE